MTTPELKFRLHTRGFRLHTGGERSMIRVAASGW
jgi:hypothetical protein